MTIRTCGFISHQPTRFKFGWDEEDELCNELKQVIQQQLQRLRQEGFSSFSVVPDSGAGLWFGEILNTLRENDSKLSLQCILPHEETATKWTPGLRDRYFTLLERSTHVSVASRPGDRDARRKALIRMIGCCDFLIAVYDPDSRRGDAVDQAMFYLINSQKPYLLIHPDTLAVLSPSTNNG